MPRKKKRRQKHKMYDRVRDLDSIVIFKICALGRWGFYASTIASVMVAHEGIRLTESSIRYVLRKHDIHTTAYRRGEGTEANEMIDSLMGRQRVTKAA